LRALAYSSILCPINFDNFVETANIIPYLLSGISLALTAVASPGPFQAYLISQTLKNGWRQTLIASLSPLISDGPIILLTLLVLTRVPEIFLRGIQIVGGALLLYFAWRTWRAYQGFDSSSLLNREPGSQNLKEAALVNALSPGPWIFWSLIAGPILLEGWRISPWFGFAFLFGFYATMVLGLATFILILGTARELGSKFTHMLLGVSTVILLFFGLYQIYTGIFS
jgi:threonine/homoserine/homoserine lactone efflux protein